MSEVKKIKINGTDISIKDETARTGIAANSEAIAAEAEARKNADTNYTGDNRTSTVEGDDTRTAGDITDTADNIVIHAKASILMDSDGSYTEDIEGKKKIDADSIEETYQKTRSIHVVGQQTEAIDSSATKSIDGTYSKIVTGAATETYKDSLNVTAKNSTETVTEKKTIKAADIALDPTSGALTYSEPVKNNKLVTVPMKSTTGVLYNLLCEGSRLGDELPYIFNADNTGTTDVSAALNAACQQYRGIIIPPGTYRIDSPVNATLCQIQGIGATLTAGAVIDTVLYYENGGDFKQLHDLHIDCASKAKCGIRVMNTPGMVLDTITIRNATSVGISLGTADTSAGGGHININNCMVYNNETLATCILNNSPDTVIRDCELYYTNCAIDCYATYLMLYNTHLWSGGAAANKLTEDKAINLRPELVSLDISGLYIDSFTFGIYTDNRIWCNGNNIFFYNDTERNEMKTSIGVRCNLWSRFLINAVAGGSHVPFYPLTYSDLQAYINTEPPKDNKKMYFSGCIGSPNTLTSMANDLSCYPEKITLAIKGENLNGYFLIGKIIPSDSSDIDFYVGNAVGECHFKYWTDKARTKDNINVSGCTNTTAYTFHIGARQTETIAGTEVVSYPVYVQHGDTIPFQIYGYAGNLAACVCLTYISKVEAPNIIATISPTS